MAKHLVVRDPGPPLSALFPSIRECIRERKESRTVDYMAADRERADRIVRCAFKGCRIGKVPKTRRDKGRSKPRAYPEPEI